MFKSHCRLILLSFSILLAACGSDGASGGGGGNAKPKSTDVGSPTGSVTSQIIGTGGGSITSTDGRLALTVPAGALTADTTIAITPISNKAHGGVGTAYRLTPDGTTFAQAVTLTFGFADGELGGNDPGVLGAAFQTADGFWEWLGTPTVDATARTVTVTSTHFTDVSLVEGLRIMPVSARVKTGERLGLHVVACYPKFVEGEDLQPLGLDCGADEEAAVAPAIVSDWAVNGTVGGSSGAGTVRASGASASYEAPSAKPQANPVAVSARANAGRGGSVLLVSNVTVDDDSPGYSGTVTWSLSPPAFTNGTATVNFTFAKTFQFSTAYRATGTVSATYTGQGCAPVSVTAPLVTAADADDFNDGSFLETVNSDSPVFPKSLQFSLKGEPQRKTLTCGLNTSAPFTMEQDIELIVAVTYCPPAGYPTYDEASSLTGSQACTTPVTQTTWTFTR